MMTRAPAAHVLRSAFFLTLAALSSACETAGDGGAAASGTTEVKAAINAKSETKANSETKAEAKAEAKGDLTAGKPAGSNFAGAAVEAHATPGKAQLDVAAAQLATANAALNGVAKLRASVEANAQPGNPSLKVSKPGAEVDAKVQAGNPSLNIGKAGALIDANVQAGKPSLNIGGLKAAANTSSSAGTPADTSKTGASAGAKAKVNLGVGQ